MQNNLLSDLSKKGFSPIYSPLEVSLLRETVEAYREFDHKFPEVMKRDTYMVYCPKKRVKLGQQKKDKNKGFDNKSLFHYHPILLEKQALTHLPEYNRFIEAMHEVYLKAETMMGEIMGELRELGVVKNYWMNNNPFTNVRILNYKPFGQDTLAKVHTDRGAFTSTLYETDPGLTLHTSSHSIPVEYKPNKSIFFAGDDWNEIITHSVEPLKHGVIHTGSNKQRSAIVVFNNPVIK